MVLENQWYKQALAHAITHKITSDLTIKSVTAPYFLATKIEAFKARGNNDFFESHDFEDIITVIAGRVEIADEVISSNAELKNYLNQTFTTIMQDDQFELALPGHVSDGARTSE